jgi:hypothetical protein
MIEPVISCATAGIAARSTTARIAARYLKRIRTSSFEVEEWPPVTGSPATVDGERDGLGLPL